LRCWRTGQRTKCTPAEASLPWETPTRSAASKLRASFQGSPCNSCPLPQPCLSSAYRTPVVLRSLKSLCVPRNPAWLPFARSAHTHDQDNLCPRARTSPSRLSGCIIKDAHAHSHSTPPWVRVTASPWCSPTKVRLLLAALFFVQRCCRPASWPLPHLFCTCHSCGEA
jgi:hypothetical protein